MYIIYIKNNKNCIAQHDDGKQHHVVCFCLNIRIMINNNIILYYLLYNILINITKVAYFYVCCTSIRILFITIIRSAFLHVVVGCWLLLGC